jgi:hypothetical protein
MSIQQVVRPGACFRPIASGALGGRPTAWRVIDVYTTSDGLLHARIVAADDATRSKTVAAAILADRRRYAQVDPGEPG